MEIVKRYPDMIEVRYSYFADGLSSTRCFEENMLDKERKITKELTVFYSERKEECVEWLEEKRNKLLHSYKLNYDRLEKSQIKEVEEKID